MTIGESTQNKSSDELKNMMDSFLIKEKAYKTQINYLLEQVRQFQSMLFGIKSEKIPLVDEKQLTLFDIPEKDFPIAKEDEEETEVSSHTRKKRGRKPLPEELPRTDVIHDLSDDEKICGCGCIKECIGKDTSEQLDIEPAKVKVIRNIRLKYVCKNCEGVDDDGPTVSIARMPDQLIPKCMGTPGLLAYVMTAKFVDSMPFYRMEKKFMRMGIKLPRATMCGWAMKITDGCGILLDLLKNEVRSGPLINADETPLKVLSELKKSANSKCYMWVYHGGSTGKPAVIYQYDPTRSGDVAAAFLKGYHGYVQTDGYSGYNFLDHAKDITHVGCWVHSRRKFIDVTKAAGSSGKKKKGKAHEALKYIRKLYKIEKKAKEKELTPEELVQETLEKALPILNEFKQWLDNTLDITPPKGLLGKAVSYTLNQWHRLINYIDNGHVTPDNNIAENAIRPFVVGRKNWLFSGTHDGAKASAAMYSLIETAKANDIEPYWYLRYLFKNLPTAMTTEEFKALLPMYVDKSKLNIPEYK